MKVNTTNGAYLKLFGSSACDEEFLQHLDALLGLPPEEAGKVFALFVIRDNLLEMPEFESLSPIADQAKCSYRSIHEAARVIHFFVRALVRSDLSAEDISADLLALGRTGKEVEVLLQLLERHVFEHRPMLRQHALKRAATNSTIDTLKSVGCSLDLRAIFEEEGELIDLEPILLMRLTICGNEAEHEVSFQVNEKRLNLLIELLLEKQVKMSELKVRAQLMPPPSKEVS